MVAKGISSAATTERAIVSGFSFGPMLWCPAPNNEMSVSIHANPKAIVTSLRRTESPRDRIPPKSPCGSVVLVISNNIDAFFADFDGFSPCAASRRKWLPSAHLGRHMHRGHRGQVSCTISIRLCRVVQAFSWMSIRGSGTGAACVVATASQPSLGGTTSIAATTSELRRGYP